MSKKLLCILFLSALPFQHLQAVPADLFALDADVSAPAAAHTPFRAAASFDSKTGIIHFTIKADKGAYVYKDSLNLRADAQSQAELKPLPAASEHNDINGLVYVYTENVDIYAQVTKSDTGSIVTLSFRGCDESGICYPPEEYSVTLPKFEAAISPDIKKTSGRIEDRSSDRNSAAYSLFEQQQNESGNASVFATGGTVATLLLFLLLGAGLDLTPCVLPLLGIFSAMIMGQGALSLKRSLALNLSYLCGLTLVYTGLGWIFSSLGMYAHVFLSSALFTVIAGGIFIVLAADCLNLITLKPPKLFNNLINQRLSSQKRGRIPSAFIFGAFSGLLTTPCTSAPLAGALLYIAKEGDMLKGTLMFAAIGLGMGLPLCLVGLFGTKLLPKSGGAAVIIRRLMSVPLLFAAFMIMQPLWSYDRTAQIVFAGLITMLTVMILNSSSARIHKGPGLISAVLYGLCVAFCSAHILTAATGRLPFTAISSIDDLKSYQGRPIYLSFSASWCGNCHVMDDKVYADDSFKQDLNDAGMAALLLDMSDPQKKEVTEAAELYFIKGVPAALIIDNGRVVKRLDGYHDLMETKEFLREYTTR